MFGTRFTSRSKSDNLGIIDMGSRAINAKYRSRPLEDIDRYLKGTQYDHLADWDESEELEDYVKIRLRKPRLIFPFLKTLSDRVGAKLFGQSVFPSFSIEDDPDTELFVKLILSGTDLRSTLLSATKYFISMGSMFIRYKLVNGMVSLQYYNPKFCYPKFKDNELESIEIKYTYMDWEDQDENGKPTEKWYKLELGKDTDVLYDNPEYKEGSNEPKFEEMARTDHGLGFVQGEWFRTSNDEHSPDGKRCSEDLFKFIDAINYKISQMDSASSYGLDPQLMFKNMDEDEIDTLVKSSENAWALGREGEASYLETSGSGLDVAERQKQSNFKDIQDASRIVFLDPEKIVGSSQSAKAMEVLHGPLVELIDELRPMAEKGLKLLITKIVMSLIIYNRRGMQLAFSMPPQYRPKSMNMKLTWPAIFPLTTQDRQAIISNVVSLTSGNIIARDTGLKWLMAQMPDMPIEDIELEIHKINNQKEFNSFAF